MIKINNLKKCFGSNEVLNDVSCEVKTGEIISIIGPSGCGKSTFIRCINLLERPTSGEIIIEGENILDSNVDVNSIRQHMGMVFQSFNLYVHLMVIENIMLGPIKLLNLSRQEAFEQGMEYLELVGLAEKAYAYPDELSGGQKQRVAIARTLAMKPKIILFDEPTSALDPTMVSEVLSVMRKLAVKGHTMLIVTHEMKFARDISTRVFYMDDKGIYESGTAEEIFENPKRPKTREFIQKIRSFSYQIESSKFDLYVLNAGVEIFLQKQLQTDKRISSVLLVCEELLCNIVQVAKSELLVEFSDISGEITIVLKYKGDMRNPLEKSEDLSMKIVNKSAKDVSYSYQADENIIKIIM